MIAELSEAQCSYAMEHGEFGPDVLGAASDVAVILTQSWCPEWRVMRALLSRSADRPETRVFFVEYDRKSWFGPFMAFKEESFRNAFVPYVRYYRDATSIGESNFVGPDQFWEFFD